MMTRGAVGKGTGDRLADRAGFRLTWTAATVSGFGTYITELAVSVLVVLTLHGGATEVGLVEAGGWLPYLLFGVFVGVLTDRLRRRPTLVATDLGRGVLLTAIPLLAWTGHLTVAWLIGLMAVFGLLSLFHDAAFQSFIPRLVPSRLLTPAHARLDQSDAVAQTSGPALAGGLISLVGASAAVLFDSASYFVSGLLFARVRVAEPPRASLSFAGVGREAAQGLRWVYRHATLRPMAIGTHAWFFFMAVAGAVITPFALRTLGLSPFGLGLALAAVGVGGLAGSLVAVRLGARFGVGRVVIASDVFTAMAWGLAALSGHSWPGWLSFGAGQLVLGLGIGIDNANTMGYRQIVTPDALQGRMNATMRSNNRAMIVVGAPLGGLVGDAIGYRQILWITAAGFLVVAASLTLSRFRTARLDDEHATSIQQGFAGR